MKQLPKRRCEAWGCSKAFWPRIFTQKYCSLICKNRETQRRLRERAKIHKEPRDGVRGN